MAAAPQFQRGLRTKGTFREGEQAASDTQESVSLRCHFVPA